MPEVGSLPPVDLGNSLLEQTPALLTTTTTQHPLMPHLVVLTIRTNTTTLTVHLPKASALEWAQQIRDEALKVAGTSLHTGTG